MNWNWCDKSCDNKDCLGYCRSTSCINPLYNVDLESQLSIKEDINEDMNNIDSKIKEKLVKLIKEGKADRYTEEDLIRLRLDDVQGRLRYIQEDLDDLYGMLDNLQNDTIAETDDETILEHFTKVLPYAELSVDKEKVPTFCPQDLDNRLEGLCKPNYCDCYKCWTRKYKDAIEANENE